MFVCSTDWKENLPYLFNPVKSFPWEIFMMSIMVGVYSILFDIPGLLFITLFGVIGSSVFYLVSLCDAIKLAKEWAEEEKIRDERTAEQVEKLCWGLDRTEEIYKRKIEEENNLAVIKK